MGGGRADAAVLRPFPACLLLAALIALTFSTATPTIADVTAADKIAPPLPGPNDRTSKRQDSAVMTYRPVTYADIPGWTSDDQRAAWTAFRASCSPLTTAAATAVEPLTGERRGLVAACRAAVALPSSLDAARARAFFEGAFVPHLVASDPSDAAGGLLTAYYEPIVAGSRTASAAFPVPLHRRPPDLVNLVDEADRASLSQGLTHARQVNGATTPFATRRQIDDGALAGKGLELVFVADEVDRFFLQIQGSGIIAFADGTQVRIGYDGKNGHPYTSVGRVLIDSGAMSADAMSLPTLAAYLRADPERGRRAMWRNESYVFFRAMPDANAPVGVMGVPLTPRRSLAVDPAYHALGLPIFVDAPTITHITGQPFQQLMIAQDVGSAIRGRERGDIFAGSGVEAGVAAGITKHPGRFFVLLPRCLEPPLEPRPGP